MIAGGSQEHPDAWRLPAEQVEGVLTELVRTHLGRPNAASSITKGLSAAEIKTALEKLTSCNSLADCLSLIEQAHLRPGSMSIQLDAQILAKRLNCRPRQINAMELTIEAPFQMRRRGVELKLHLGDPPPEINHTLVQNIEKGRRWLAMIIDGKTFCEIAEREGISTRRVQDVANLALLAPAILDAVTLGEQPSGLTTDYLIKSRFSVVWSQQRAQFDAL